MNKERIAMRFMFLGICGGLAWAGFSATLKLPVVEVTGVADQQEKTFPARVEPVQRVEITPEVSGDIVEVCFENGQLVKQGDVLYRLMPIRYTSALKNAQAKVAESRAKKEYAEANLKRNEAVRANAVSKDALDSAKSAVAVATAALEAAEADLALADYNLKRCEIRTPISGKTGSTRLTRGNPASPATPLVTVVQVQPIRVRFSLSNGEYLTMFGGRSSVLKAKGEVSVTLANGTAYGEKGTVEYVENLVDESTDTIRVYATFPNAERILKPGGTVGVMVRNREGVVKSAIPPTAVMQDVRGPFVWVVGADGKAVRRSIVRGRLTADVQLVESGLTVGERVVSDGTHKVSAGDVIEAVK